MDRSGVVIVEGASDRAALEALARRLGRDLPAEGIDLVVMDGITNLPAHLRGIDDDVRVLVDQGEAAYAARPLATVLRRP